MSDEKNRFGDKLHDVEAAREEQWAAQQDAELMKQMRERLKKTMQCPDCKRNLVSHRLGDIALLACPDGDGAWIDAAGLEKLAKSTK
ncbi:MAG TPA: zf-TFIIB domain-containing protein [Candidatus Binataceae bacterium]|nr:zf-TFIIB domain-containing protein [Candidatus Binataceae bacterium]